MRKKREEINLDKITFKVLKDFVEPDCTPYTENYMDLLLKNNDETYERKHDKTKCQILTRYLQYHVWFFGEMPDYDKLKECVKIKTDEAFNKYIIALNNHPEWIEIIFIKPKWKTRFREMGLQVRG
ncbi:hypothetical protein [Clostridium ljungdahlii]|uniref:Uncharacterized protein n=1 Tax=Clostridium ljungdahlii TaxID=1538 RepID=A0A168MHR4_9CLOT|nr:hypothetical protein [Clostridium ljungdahlii]OAA84707.1 hypothetical protein WY13_02606 [Clostridium ljungdahlii]